MQKQVLPIIIHCNEFENMSGPPQQICQSILQINFLFHSSISIEYFNEFPFDIWIFWMLKTPLTIIIIYPVTLSIPSSMRQLSYHKSAIP